MPSIVCTPKLRNIGPIEPVVYPGATVGEVFDALTADYPRLKNYVLDDQGRVRKHVAIFIGGTLQARETVLACSLRETDEIYVMQALSGG
jgi:molybdopterin converting factor small subunit